MDEVQVVEVRLGRQREVPPVGGDGALVGVGRVVVPAHACIDVRGHVHEVTGARHEIDQTVGGRQRLLGLVRRLHRVDVEVVRAGMVGVDLEHPLEGDDDFGRPTLGPAVLVPEIPRLQIHQRLGVERTDVRIVGVRLPGKLHGVGVRTVEEAAVLGGGPRVALCDGHDQCPLLRREARDVLERLLRGLPAAA